MRCEDERLARLAHVAKRYYLEDQKQSDIAKELSVSRPMVSKMLAEARALGVVEIKIHSHNGSDRQLFTFLHDRYHIMGGTLVDDEEREEATNQSLSHAAIHLLSTLKSKRLGLGWGHLIGEMVNYLERTDDPLPQLFTICPMIGNAGIPIRQYQSTETVRVFADKLGATPYFLNLPALANDMEEKNVLCGTESYRKMLKQWERLDTAFVNIGNHPATPDFASGARYGTLLQQNKACGRIICRYFNQEGEIIHSDQDFSLQMPLEYLTHCKNVVGLCSGNTNVAALEGALRTGFFTHLIAKRSLINQLK